MPRPAPIHLQALLCAAALAGCVSGDPDLPPADPDTPGLHAHAGLRPFRPSDTDGDDEEARIYPHEDIAPGIQAPFGEPMPRSTPEQLEAFYRGKAIFTRQYTVADGLGPDFLTTSCLSCHERPTAGGSAGLYRNAFLGGRADGDAFRIADRDLLPRDTVNAAIVRVYRFGGDGKGRGVLPERGIDTFSSLNPIPLYGIGLFAQVPADEISSRTDPDDRDGDGVSGRTFTYSQGIGRIGFKAETVGVQEIATASFQEMNELTMVPLTAEQIATLPFGDGPDPHFTDHDGDGVADPEIPQSDLYDVIMYEQMLAAPEFDLMTARELRGRERFDEIGCATCHTPRLNSPAGLIPAYSDLLLHDMGPRGGDGVAFPPRSLPNELRTMPLWGVAAAAPYMVDGRALTLHDAIVEHWGEGEPSRDAYLSLSEAEQAEIVDFMRTLGGREYGVQNLIPPGGAAPTVGEAGGPDHDLADKQERFEKGRAEFDRMFGLQEGLGTPFFNGDACSSCHFLPAIGGSGPVDVNVMRQGRLAPGGVFVPSPEGDMVAKHRLIDRTPFQPDREADIVEHRQTTHSFGIGLLETIADPEIVSRADPDDLDGDGISGRVAWLANGHLGRMGWKGQIESALDITCTAFGVEMGLTSSPTVCETFGLREDADGVPDPELEDETVKLVVEFMRALAPPARAPATEASLRGEVAFATLGCAACHVPSLPGRDGPVDCFSDLLLHDVSLTPHPGIAEAAATMEEYRTAPLWGLRDSGPYLHTGLAVTVDEAIRQHGGEGGGSRLAYEFASEQVQSDLIAFLLTL